MQFFYEIIPVFLFFLAFKFYGIYAATVVGIVTTFIQVVISRLWMKAWDKKQLITLAVFVVFGGMTLYFHNPIFVKWKPTVVFWVFAFVLIITNYFTHKPLMQRMMENMLQDKNVIPSEVWRKINLAWAGFFILLGSVNLYVAYYYSNDAWVNFKFYGVTSALFLFSIVQAVYMSRYLVERSQTHDEKH